MTDTEDVKVQEATGAKFNFNAFLKANDQNCKTVAQVGKPKTLSVHRRHKSQGESRNLKKFSRI